MRHYMGPGFGIHACAQIFAHQVFFQGNFGHFVRNRLGMSVFWSFGSFFPESAFVSAPPQKSRGRSFRQPIFFRGFGV